MAVLLKTPLVIVNDDDLVRVSRDNPGYRFEREEDGTIIVSPTHTKGGAKSLEAAAQLRDYKKQVGGNAYDSNTGFAIGPLQRVYAPDASWVSQPRIDALTLAQASGFWPLSPDVAIEVCPRRHARVQRDYFVTTRNKQQSFCLDRQYAPRICAIQGITRSFRP